jgi:hypothetical protein
MSDSRKSADGKTLPANLCPNCGKELDAATGIDPNARPKPGDFSVCLGCGHLMAFGNDLRLRPLTAVEVIEVAGNPQLLAAQDFAGAFRKSQNAKKSARPA